MALRGMFNTTKNYYGETAAERYSELRSNLWALDLELTKVTGSYLQKVVRTTRGEELMKLSLSASYNVTMLASTPTHITQKEVAASIGAFYYAAGFYNVYMKSMTELNAYSPDEFFLLTNGMSLVYLVTTIASGLFAEMVLAFPINNARSSPTSTTALPPSSP